MNQTLTSIFETQGPQSLNISNQSFSEDNIFEEFIDSSFFHQDGKYWSYKKYTPGEVKNLLPKCDSVKIAKRNQEPRPEL